MNIQEAARLTVELARGNILDEDQVAGDVGLREELGRQEEATDATAALLFSCHPPGPFTVYLRSDAFGDEEFPRESLLEALETIRNLAVQVADRNDGVAREIGLWINKPADENGA